MGFFMSSMSTIFLNANSNPNSILEKAGDFFLKPVRATFKGHRFVFFKKDQQILRYENFEQKKAIERQEILESMSLLSQRDIALKKVIEIARWGLVPLGFPLKMIAFCASKKVREGYKNWTPLDLSTKDEDSIINLFYSLDLQFVPEFYKDIAHHPLRYAHFQEDANSKVFFFFPLRFWECGCLNSRFNRLLSDRRSNIEKAIISDLKKRCSVESLISILSFGSGGLFQDFVILGKLIQIGYKRISFSLLDPQIDNEKVDSLRNFAENIPDVQIEIKSYKNIREISQDEMFDTAYAIDFDQFEYKKSQPPLDAIETLKHLKPEGRFYLSFYQEDLVWKGKEKLKHIKGGCHGTIISDVSKKIKSFMSKHINQPIEIGILSNVSWVLSPLLGMLKALNNISKKLTLNFTVEPRDERKNQYFESSPENIGQIVTLLFGKFPNLSVEIDTVKELVDLYFAVEDVSLKNPFKGIEKLYLKKHGRGFIREELSVKTIFPE